MTSTRWCFTLNNPTEGEISSIVSLSDLTKVRYLIFGRETAPSTGTLHLQGFVVLEKKSRLSGVKKVLPSRCHFELARGSSLQASEYCRKEGNVTEFGELPLTASESAGESQICRWDSARKAAKEGRFDDIPSDLYCRYMGNFKKIYTDSQSIPASVSQLDFHWYYGESGTGKSIAARALTSHYYLKGLNKWWDGYTSQDVVIIEEWTPMDLSAEKIMGHYLKQWADHHPFQAEFKGGMRMIRPKTIIVTSNYTIEECFHDPQTVQPLKRRFKVKEFHNCVFNPSMTHDTVDQ